MDPSRLQPRLRPTTSSSWQDGESDLASFAVNLNDYIHSPPHLCVAKNDLNQLRRLLSDNDRSSAAAVVDRRDVVRGETPLHLAVRLGRHTAAAVLLSAGADPSLQDAAGWTPFQESLLLRRPRAISLLLLRHHHLSALRKWQQRLPSLVSALRRVSDFYLELSFRFESSVLPPFLLARAAPSDTYRIWKRGASVRADTSLAGFDGLRVSRAERTFLFLGDGSSDPPRSVDPGTLLILDRGRKQVRDALESVSAAIDEEGGMTTEEEEEMVGEEAAAKIYRPGVDVTKAEVVPRTNWRRKEKVEMVGEWKAKVYDVDKVFFTLKTRKSVRQLRQPDGNLYDPARDVELVLADDDDDDGEDGEFLVAEIPPTKAAAPPRHSCCEPSRKGDPDHGFNVGARRRKSVDGGAPLQLNFDRKRSDVESGKTTGNLNYDHYYATSTKEKETVKSLRPTVWLTDEFPLKTEEMVPLLDVLADKVKAVRRIRELLTAKFPPGTFPVKLSIPVVPTVRVVVTFSKFAELQTPKEQFFTPPSSPRQFAEEEEEEDQQKSGQESRSSWLRWTGGNSTKSSSARVKAVSPTPPASDLADPFSIPKDYTWVSSRKKNLKRSKTRTGSHRGRVLAL